MVEQHKKDLKKQLWTIANTLRGNMSADDFRDYILGFIFYKYLSEKMDIYGVELLSQSPEISEKEYSKLDEELEVVIEGKNELVIDLFKDEAIENLGYFLKPSELFNVLAEKGNTGGFILEDLSEILAHIEQSTMGTDSEDDFNGLFDDLDLTSNRLGRTEAAKNELISKVLTHLDDIDFLHHETDIDVLGDAYEYLIGKFASGAGKGAGEFYTPPAVSTLLAKIVTFGKEKIKSVYDPTCGSGSLLLKVTNEFIGKESHKDIKVYGQESNPTTYNLARMNMILHGIHYRNFDIQQDDTLEEPHHVEKRFEAVVANPPFSANWSASAGFLTDERFQDYGKLAPKSKADFAFVQHMIHQLDENGTMAVVLPHGALFRGAAEGHIRKHLIKDKNYLDAVIGLPANIFYGTSIPTCILVLKKNRQHRDNILFIDASQNFGKASNQNYLRDKDLEKILKALEKRKFIDKYAFVAQITGPENIETITSSEFNLNISRYVDTFEDEPLIDISATNEALCKLDINLDNVEKQIATFCLELDVKYGNNS
jgi:type I restriction enzyme M protein